MITSEHYPLPQVVILTQESSVSVLSSQLPKIVHGKAKKLKAEPVFVYVAADIIGIMVDRVHETPFILRCKLRRKDAMTVHRLSAQNDKSRNRLSTILPPFILKRAVTVKV